MALRTLARRLLAGSIFHLRARDYPKHVENSDRGDRMAKRRGKRGIDLDILITRDNRVVNTHWGQPMVRDGFRDPFGQLQPTTPVKRMTWAEASRLRAGRWPRRYRIRSIEHALRHCARLGLVAVLEPKGDQRFTKDLVWQEIAKTAEVFGCTVSVRALPENADALPAARRAGFKAWEI